MGIAVPASDMPDSIVPADDLPEVSASDSEEPNSPEADEARALTGGSQALAHTVVGGTLGVAGKLAGRVADVLPGGADWTRAPRKADTWGEAGGSVMAPTTPEGQGVEEAAGMAASAAGRAVAKIPGADTPLGRTALETGGELLQDVGLVSGAAGLARGVGRIASEARRVKPVAEGTAPASPAGYTRADFEPKVDPSPVPEAPTAPTPPPAAKTPSAAPDHAGKPAPDVHDPGFFPAPDNQDLKSQPASPQEQVTRQAAVERGAPTLPQVRDSAITNDYGDQGRDWTGKQAGDPHATAQIASEAQALHSEAGRVSADTGGQLGTGESADTVRGRAYQDWHDTTVEALKKHIDAAYATEDAAAKQIATPASNLKGVLTDDSLIDSANAGSVRSSTIALARKMGVDLTDPNAQLNAWQVEQLRKHAVSIYGNAPRLAQAIKNAADTDLPPGAYVQARALNKLKSQLFDNRDGINQLGPSKDIDPDTGKPRPENRPVKAPDVMKKIESMDPGQVQHIVSTMKNSSTILARLGDTDAAAAITDKAHKAAQQLQSHFTERWTDEAGKGGGWNTRRAHQFLRSNQETLASIMSPEQMHQIRNVTNAANVLDLDKRYKGAFAQFKTGASWLRQRLGRTAEGMISDAIPFGNTIGEMTGASEWARGKLSGKDKTNLPKNFTRPLGQKIPGQGGWIGNKPEPADFAKEGEHVTMATPHEHFVDENGDHNFTTAGGNSWLKAEPQPDGGLRVRGSFTDESERKQGNAGVLYKNAADHALSQGGTLSSDSIVSDKAARRWQELRDQGYTLERNPNAKKTSIGMIAENDEPVFRVSGRQQPRKPLGQIIGGGSQRGGPKAGGDPYNMTPDAKKPPSTGSGNPYDTAKPRQDPWGAERAVVDRRPLGARMGGKQRGAVGDLGKVQAATDAKEAAAAHPGPGSAPPSIMGLAKTFDDAISHHLSLSPEDRIANSKAMSERVSQYVGKTKDGKAKPLLGQNAKLMKSETGYGGAKPIELPDGRGVETTGLALSPAYQEGKFTTCPNSASCKSECLGKTSGNYFKLGGGTDLSAFKGPRLNSFNKTQAFLRDPEAFAVRLNDEITSAKNEAAKNGNKLGVRLNVLSDINPRVHKAIMEAHPDVQFYDYTKNNSDPIAPNHHYTYSSTGASQEGVENPNQNWKQMRRRLDGGDNVAMAFTHKDHLPEVVHDAETNKSYKVIDGDTHDYRPLDKVPAGTDGVIVGLRNKKATGKMQEAHKDSNGFFMHYDPQLKMNEKGTYARGPSPGISPNTGKPMLGDTLPQNRAVTIKPQAKSRVTLTNDSKAVT